MLIAVAPARTTGALRLGLVVYAAGNASVDTTLAILNEKGEVPATMAEVMRGHLQTFRSASGG